MFFLDGGEAGDGGEGVAAEEGDECADAVFGTGFRVEEDLAPVFSDDGPGAVGLAGVFFVFVFAGEQRRDVAGGAECPVVECAVGGAAQVADCLAQSVHDVEDIEPRG